MKSETRFRCVRRGRGARDEPRHRLCGLQHDRHRKRLRRPRALRRSPTPRSARSAYFVELGKVLTHPRCVNCHPAGDRPRQGDEGRPHEPPVWRGADGHGLPAMRCPICHQKANFEPGRVPGHPEWHLAPRSMAWEGKTLARDLRTDQGSGAQRQPQGRGPDPPHRRGHAGRLGLGARLRPPARARHAEAGRRAGRSLGEKRRRVPGRVTCAPMYLENRHPDYGRALDPADADALGAAGRATHRAFPVVLRGRCPDAAAQPRGARRRVRRRRAPCEG